MCATKPVTVPEGIIKPVTDPGSIAEPVTAFAEAFFEHFYAAFPKVSQNKNGGGETTPTT